MKYKVTKTFEYHERDYEMKIGGIYSLHQISNGGDDIFLINEHGDFVHFYKWMVFPVFPNRQFLADFLKLNNIKKTLVSQYLGYSENWLTQMANDKRRDMKDETLKSILKKLHIDWTQDTFIHVKATKEHTAYRTRPCTYKHDKHKERLQRAMWDGLFVKA